MIVKNEENNIKKSIESYKNIVDEIIVVDTGSDDNTVKIAKELGAKTYFFKWINDFSAAKNFALKKAKYDWIIFLDADEYFEVDTTKNILNIIKSIHHDLKIDCINSTIINIEKTTNKIQDRATVIRIFRNKEYIKYRNKIHECLMKSNNAPVVGLKGYEDNVLIKHTGYSKKNFSLKIKRNLQLLLSELKTSESKEDIYFYLVNTYGAIKDYDNAIKYAKLYIESGKEIKNYSTYIPYLLIDCMMKNGESYEILIDEIKKYISKYPNAQAFTCYAGIITYNNGRYNDALKHFERTIFLRKNYKDTEYYQELIANDAIFYYMAQIYYLKNETSKDIEFYTKCLIENRNNDEALIQLLILIKIEDSSEIINLLNAIYDINNFDDMKYLISKLSFMKYGEILFYYHNIWFNIFKQEDSVVISTFLGNAKFNESFELLLRCFNEEKNDWDERLLVVAALLSNNIENIDKIKGIISDTYRNFIYCYYYHNEDIFFEENEINEFINLISEFILIAESNDELEKLINIKYKFQLNISNLIGDVLIKWGVFDWALEEYKDYLKDNPYKADVCFNAGVCSYKIGDYKNALEFFNDALKYGYIKHDLYEFVNWIVTGSENEKIIKNAKQILNYKEKLK